MHSLSIPGRFPHAKVPSCVHGHPLSACLCGGPGALCAPTALTSSSKYGNKEQLGERALWVYFFGEGGGILQAAGSLIPAAGLSASQMAGPGQSPGSQPELTG